MMPRNKKIELEEVVSEQEIIEEKFVEIEQAAIEKEKIKYKIVCVAPNYLIIFKDGNNVRVDMLDAKSKYKNGDIIEL
jgi:hypothetical protein